MSSGRFPASLTVTLLFVSSLGALAKSKPRIIIQVVNSETSQREYTSTIPGRKGTAQTNCTTDGTTHGTISDYGVGPIQTDSTGNANTNCTTTTTAATPPQTVLRTGVQQFVYAVLPDGRHLTLSCQKDEMGSFQAGFGGAGMPYSDTPRCSDLRPGKYEAEIRGNSLTIFTHDLSGKEHKDKYKAVSVEQASVTAPAPTPTTSSQAQNPETAKEQSAADSPETQFHLGAMYENGNGVPQDYAQAAIWYRKAADQGDAKAEYRLGVLYANGLGVPQDKTQAAGLFLSAAKEGYAPAYALIGGAYLTGDGVPIDYAEASFWFAVATVTESQPTLAKADALQLRVAGLYLSQADLSRVKERARAWIEKHPAIQPQ